MTASAKPRHQRVRLMSPCLKAYTHIMHNKHSFSFYSITWIEYFVCFGNILTSVWISIFVCLDKCLSLWLFWARFIILKKLWSQFQTEDIREVLWELKHLSPPDDYSLQAGFRSSAAGKAKWSLLSSYCWRAVLTDFPSTNGHLVPLFLTFHFQRLPDLRVSSCWINVY